MFELRFRSRRDQETELDYRGARYYDSDVARFLSLDPLAADYAAWSPYNYVMGNPISLIDPTGRNATNYVTEAGAPIANTKDGNEATVTIGNEHLEAFRKELSQMVVDKDSPSNNAEWIGAYGKGMAANQGQNVPTWAMSALRGGASDQGVDWGLVGSVSFFSEQGFNGVAALAKASANFNPHYAYRGMAEAEAAAARGLGNIAKVTKAAGGSAMGINMGATALGYYQSDRSGADKARYWGGVTITAIGVCYPPVGIGLGALEAVGTFDSFYNSFDPEDLVR